MQAAVRAYANIPDGQDLKVFKNPDGSLRYQVTGDDGKVVSKGIASPQELGEHALKITKGGFEEFILSAAGQRAAKKEPPVAKIADVKTGSELMDTAFGEPKEGEDADAHA